jgi:DNA-directed RNA polymerase omega subunit
MYYTELEKLVDKTGGSVYKLVVLASKRALELSEGQARLIGDISSSAKPSTIALKEIEQGKLTIKA